MKKLLAVLFNWRVWLIVGLVIGALFGAFIWTGRAVVASYDYGEFPRMHQIATTYAAYLKSSKDSHMLEAKSGFTAHMAAYYLAKEEGLNDATVYFQPKDASSPKEIPKVVMFDLVAGDTMPKINPDFMDAELSVVIAANVSSDAPPASTPIVWTRGLREDGTWAPDSPFKGDYGYVAYLDGHSEKCDRFSLNGISFVKYGTNTPTINIREALPPGAVILSAEPNGKGN